MEPEERAGSTPTPPWCGLGLGYREWVTQGRVTRGPRRLFREPLSCKAGQPRLWPALGQSWDSRYLELAALRGTQVILVGLLRGPGSALLVDRSRRLPQRRLKSCSPRMETPLLCTGREGSCISSPPTAQCSVKCLRLDPARAPGDASPTGMPGPPPPSPSWWLGSGGVAGRCCSGPARKSMARPSSEGGQGRRDLC